MPSGDSRNARDRPFVAVVAPTVAAVCARSADASAKLLAVCAMTIGIDATAATLPAA
jgi:hypothetical protein